MHFVYDEDDGRCYWQHFRGNCVLLFAQESSEKSLKALQTYSDSKSFKKRVFS